MKGSFLVSSAQLAMFISSLYFLITRYIRPICGQTIQHWEIKVIYKLIEKSLDLFDLIDLMENQLVLLQWQAGPYN